MKSSKFAVREQGPPTEVRCNTCGEVVATLRPGERVATSATATAERTVRGECKCGARYAIPLVRE